LAEKGRKRKGLRVEETERTERGLEKDGREKR
jgi:hypothetical protein